MTVSDLFVRARFAVEDMLANLLAASDSSPQQPVRHLELSELEDRVMLNAAPLAVFAPDAGETFQVAQLDPSAGVIEESTANLAENTSAQALAPPPSEEQAADSSLGDAGDQLLLTEQEVRRELVFVDAGVADYQQLLDDLLLNGEPGRELDVVLLTSDRDGIEQISKALALYDDLDAVHIVSHGIEGAVKLGNTWLTANNLSAYTGQISGWQDALTTDADLLFYGCDLASSEEGQLLVESLGALCDCDVAASVDDTGHAQYGGDWDFEHSTGSIEASVAFSTDVQQNWSGLLAVVTVDSTTDVSDALDLSTIAALIGDPGVDGFISLREAITAANNSTGTDEIHFEILDAVVSGVHTIAVTGSGLPTITEELIIDGRTDSDFVNSPVIVLDGNGVTGAVNGITLTATSDGSVIRNLAINRFSDDGVLIQSGADNVTISGNWIGSDGTGSSLAGNGDDGIDIRGANATIGGLGADDGNVINNSADEGITINGAGTTIIGNIIGLEADGSSGTGNADVGIALLTGADNTTIGGITTAHRNVISNNFEGIEINTDSNIVQGNYIGTDATGTLARGNGSDDGIEIQNGGTGNVIGGSSANAGNIIADNAGYGVNIVSALNTTIQGNTIGSGVTGTEDLGNSLSGIRLAGPASSNTLIGGLNAGEGNLIAFNQQRGIETSGNGGDDRIEGNVIHSQDLSGILSFRTGTSVVGNFVYSNSTTITFDEVIIGNDHAVYHNTIHNSPGDGISVEGTNAVIRNNIVTGSAGFGIRIDGGTISDESYNLITDAVTGPANLGGQANFTVDTSTLNADPQYTNTATGDFSLVDPTSPAIDAGVDLGASQPDRNGAAAGLYNGAAPDIGASESLNDAPEATDDPGQFNALVTTLSPVSYWRLGESAGPTATDESAISDGTYNGTTPGQSGALAGESNTAVSFDGVNDYVEIAHNAAYLIDDGTVQLWFNADTPANGDLQHLFSKDSTGFDTGGHLSIYLDAAGKLTTRLQSTTANYVVSTTESVTGSAWHHVALSFGNDGLKLYLDGALIDTDAYTGGLGTTSGGAGNFEPIAIGAGTQTSGNLVVTPVSQLFAGRIDEVAIFSSQLGAAAVQDLYASALQYYTINEDTSLNVSIESGVLANDSDVENDPLTVSLVNGPSNAASFMLNADGSFSYTPNTDFSGTDTFTYKANDGTDDSNVATVTIDVTPINDAPSLSATADNPTFTEGGAAAGLYSSTSIDLVEAGDSVKTLTLTMAGLQNGADEILSVDGTDVALTHLNSLTTAANSYDVNVTVSGGTATVTITKVGDYTAAAAETLVDGLAYENTSDDPLGANRTATLTLIQDNGGTAGGGDDDAVLAIGSTVSLTAINDAPSLGATADNPTFTEGGAAAGLYSSTSIDLVEAGDSVKTLTLTVAGLQNGADEILSVDGTDVALTHLNSLTTASNSYDVSVTVSAGTATVTITKVGDYTAAAAETLLDALAYENTSDDPLGATRTVTLTLIQDNGGTTGGGDDDAVLAVVSTVTLSPVNDAATITNLDGDGLAYPSGSGALVIEQGTDATVADVDSANFDTGNLTVSISAGGDPAEDVLSVRDQGTGAGQIGFDGVNVTYEGTLIGTAAGGSGGADLVITLNSDATPTAVTALVKNITYENTDTVSPTAGSRSVEFTVNDGDGDTSLAHVADVAVSVSQPPMISDLTGDSLAYDEGDGAVVIEQGADAVVTDADSTDFDTGNLTVSIPTGGDAAEDALSIRDQGGGPGQIGFDGVNVSYEGTVIGTAAGGSGGASLIVTFNVNATPTAVTALVRNITYENTDTTDPTSGARTVRYHIEDGDGGVSTIYDTTVNVTAINDAPSLSATGDDPTFTEGGAAAGLYSSTSIDLVEAGDEVKTLTLTVAGLQNGADEILNVDGTDVALTHLNSLTTAANSYDVSVTVSAGTATVTITKVGDYTAAEAETLVDALAYENTSDDPLGATRTVTLTFIQDNGGTTGGGDDDAVLSIASTVTLTAINDAPSLSATGDNPTFTEGGAAAGLYSATSIDLVEAADEVKTLTLTVAGLQNGADEILNIDGTDVALTHLNSLTTAANSYDVSVTVSGGTATVTITKVGDYTAAEAETLVDALAYENSSDNPLGATRTVTLTLIQDNGGTAGGGDDDAVLSVASTVTLAAMNDDPSNAGSLPTDIGVTEDVSSNVDLSAIDLADVDAGAGSLTVTLTTSTGGNLTAAAGAGITMGGTPTALTLSGTLTDLNNYLNTPSNITYLHGTPDTNGDDADTIQVDVTDNGNSGSGGGGTINLGTVNVDISAVNDDPVITSPSGVSVAENQTGVLTVTATDIDLPPDTISFSLSGGADQSRFSIDNSTGVLTFSNAPDFENPTDADSNNIYEVQVTAADGNSGTDVQLISVTVTNVNDAPVAVADSYSVDNNETLSAASPGLLTNDNDQDADPLTVILVSGPSQGNLNINPDGSFDYTPNGTFSGTDSFTYRISDGSLQSNVATVTITVNSVGGQPLPEEPDDTGEENGDPSNDEGEAEIIPPAAIDVDVEPPSAEQTPEPRGKGTPFRVFDQIVDTRTFETVSLAEISLPDSSLDVSKHSLTLDSSTTIGEHDNRAGEQFIATASAALEFDSEVLMQILDEFEEGLSEFSESASTIEALVVGTTATITTTLSVGYVVWLLRGGTLLASLASALPAWACLDPLAIFDDSEDEDRRKHRNQPQREDAVESFFDK